MSRVVLPLVLMVGGVALISYAGYLQYVSLPSEQAVRHVTTRAALAGGGISLVLLGTWLLR
jgi:hypothetical protein